MPSSGRLGSNIRPFWITGRSIVSIAPGCISGSASMPSPRPVPSMGKVGPNVV